MGYPSAVFAPTTKNAGDTIQPAHVNDLQTEIVAIENALLGTNHLAHDLLFVDATYDIGKSGATRPRDFFLSRNATIGGTLGVTGVATFTAAPVFSAGLGAAASALTDTVAWTNYSSTSSVTGWAATPTTKIFYYRIGKLVVVTWNITGTSNSNPTNFTLPYAANSDGFNSPEFGGALGYSLDNGSGVSGTWGIDAGSSTLKMYTNFVQAGWTTSGTKTVAGTAIYTTS